MNDNEVKTKAIEKIKNAQQFIAITDHNEEGVRGNNYLLLRRQLNRVEFRFIYRDDKWNN